MADNEHSTLDQLHVTLVELNKATENFAYVHQSLASLGILDALKSKKGLASLFSLKALQNMMKNINVDELIAIMKSPVVQRLVTDPEFLQLFLPDTGTTPGTTPIPLEERNEQETPEQDSEDKNKG